jgi:hypothetical protein
MMGKETMLAPFSRTFFYPVQPIAFTMLDMNFASSIRFSQRVA